MGREEEIRKNKIEKLKQIEQPYAYTFNKSNEISEIKQNYSEFESKQVSLAGRVMRIREHGKIIFLTLRGDDDIQLIVKDNADLLQKVKKIIDQGDWIGVKGKVGKSHRGEISVYVDSIELLSKAIFPLPEKWHELSKEIRYKQRYLDLIMNLKTRKVFLMRSKLIKSIRSWLDKHGFLEVDVPLLQVVYGGARARPFKTYLHALKQELFLSISPELYLKRLLVGGFEKVYCITKCFRNEGIDRLHNPEFTMLEAYQAWIDYNQVMQLVEDLICEVASQLKLDLIKTEQGEIKLKKPFKRLTLFEALKKYANIDPDKASRKELLEVAVNSGLEIHPEIDTGMLIAELFEKLVQPKLIEPTHILDWPKEVTPLCKLKRNNKDLVEKFETFINGMEICNGYSEENNPLREKEELEKQAKEIKRGKEGHPYDADFIHALELGMPSAGGFGLGIDRLCMLLLNLKSIRDVILFPFMKPEE
mgnify:CR=1 FL=1